MTQNNDNPLSAIMEQLISEGPDGMASVLTTLFNMAMKFERDRYLQAGVYETPLYHSKHFKKQNHLQQDC